jgi:type IV/VI secretion system ImpK/VasF family protein
MQNPLWSAIYDIFTDVDALLTQVERFGTVSPAVEGTGGAAPRRPARAAVQKLEGMRQAYSETTALVEVRSQIRSKLDMLKAALSARLTERETYLVLFPVVVRFDELVQNRFLAAAGTAWPPLQKELFEIDNGGEVFYDTLDDLLRKAETLPFVYEVYYFCLSDGFRGKYADNLAKINEYKTKLADKIPLPPVERRAERAEGPALVMVSGLPVKYYAAAALFLLWHLAGR